MTLIPATVAAGLAADPWLPVSPESRCLFIVSMTALCVFVGGLFQVLLGVLSLGKFVNYVPYPVISGLMNWALGCWWC